MKALWWSCVLGLLCMPAGVMLQKWTASQEPSSNYVVKINSSAELACSTSLRDPLGLTLMRRFHRTGTVLHLALVDGRIAKSTTVKDFAGRIRVSEAEPRDGPGLGFALRLSVLEEGDTNLYYCSWSFLGRTMGETLSTNGTLIIVNEIGPDDVCTADIAELTSVCLVTLVTSAMLYLSIGAVIFKCTQFGRKFTPGRAAATPGRPLPATPQQVPLHCPYLVTAVNT